MKWNFWSSVAGAVLSCESCFNDVRVLEGDAMPSFWLTGVARSLTNEPLFPFITTSTTPDLSSSTVQHCIPRINSYKA